ncbi:MULTISPECIES: hypothetical protein [Bradyrhizobium]|uniref:hypothetical protein n=1 Tax=Bradyrhizobium TaxID=374 RepID=UPI000B2CC456|nr:MULTISPECIES: hypothetical protein [Bradyrhizobium]MBR1366611.1 hypothetical protein [Bradyrhizobium ottawaense]
MTMPAHHHHKPDAEHPSVHGMLMVGEARVLMSHLPMFHAPHDQQIILETTLSAPGFDPQRKYVDDRTPRRPGSIHGGQSRSCCRIS